MLPTVIRRRVPNPGAARRTRILLDCGVLAGPVFVATFTVNGRRRVGYHPRREAISDLALGKGGWVQTANFFVTGFLTCAAALGLRRAARSGQAQLAIPSLVAAAGAGFIGAGIFPTDPVPDAGPLEPESLTRTGALHVASAVPVFLCLPVACLVSALDRRSPQPDSSGTVRSQGQTLAIRVALASTGFGSLVAAALAGSGFSSSGHGRWADRAGLCQRVALVTTLGWLTFHSLRVRTGVEAED